MWSEMKKKDHSTLSGVFQGVYLVLLTPDMFLQLLHEHEKLFSTNVCFCSSAFVPSCLAHGKVTVTVLVPLRCYLLSRKESNGKVDVRNSNLNHWFLVKCHSFLFIATIRKKQTGSCQIMYSSNTVLSTEAFCLHHMDFLLVDELELLMLYNQTRKRHFLVYMVTYFMYFGALKILNCCDPTQLCIELQQFSMWCY